MERQTSGFGLAFSLAGAFRNLIDALHACLAEQGFPEARPIHGFALQAIGNQAITATMLGRRLGVTKQAAGKTIGRLVELGYAERHPDPDDARALLVRRTATGDRLLQLSAEFFDREQERRILELGQARYSQLVFDLHRLAGDTPVGDLPGWMG